jgi:hypothetical protein
MNPTRGNNSPKWTSAFATARHALFQLSIDLGQLDEILSLGEQIGL